MMYAKDIRIIQRNKNKMTIIEIKIDLFELVQNGVLYFKQN